MNLLILISFLVTSRYINHNKYIFIEKPFYSRRFEVMIQRLQVFLVIVMKRNIYNKNVFFAGIPRLDYQFGTFI